MTFVVDDGGRADAGYRGFTGDCATRALAIAASRPYAEVYDLINTLAKAERPRGSKRRSSARQGVHRPTFDKAALALGGFWTPTMGIGTGTTVHLRGDELPGGRLVAVCSRHYVAVIDGVIHDTYDGSRGGTRAVYGYFTFPTQAERAVDHFTRILARDGAALERLADL